MSEYWDNSGIITQIVFGIISGMEEYLRASINAVPKMVGLYGKIPFKWTHQDGTQCKELHVDTTGLRRSWDIDFWSEKTYN